MEPERRVEAMRNLGDLKLAMGGRAKEGNFGDWDVIGVSLRAISMPNLILHSTFFSFSFLHRRGRKRNTVALQETVGTTNASKPLHMADMLRRDTILYIY